jgi:nucleoside-diphosphate-sugar epimerase
MGAEIVKIHVTGGSGFTGRFLLRALLERGHDVFALARTEQAAQSCRAEGATVVRGDLDDDLRALALIFSTGSPDALVNLAPLGLGYGPKIVSAAERAGIKRALFVSTTSIFTQLEAPSKAIRITAEKAVMGSVLRWTILRPTMIYGTPDDRNMWRLLRFLSHAPAVPLPNGGAHLQQPVHVEDLANAIVAGIERNEAIGRAYNIPGPAPLYFRNIVDLACQAVGRFPRPIPIPAEPVRRVLVALERRGAGLPIRAEQVARVVEDKAFSIAPAATDLGHTPRPFSVGIAEEAKLGRHLLSRGSLARTLIGRSSGG